MSPSEGSPSHWSTTGVAAQTRRVNADSSEYRDWEFEWKWAGRTDGEAYCFWILSCHCHRAPRISDCGARGVTSNVECRWPTISYKWWMGSSRLDLLPNKTVSRLLITVCFNYRPIFFLLPTNLLFACLLHKNILMI